MKNRNYIYIIFFLFPIQLFSQTDIVGGEDAEIQDYPYQAALINTGGWGGGYAFCGASIINEYWILTAAHCLSGESANNVSVRVGNDASYAQGGETYDAAEIIMHENYSNVSNGNDIALIRLDNPINFDNYTQPVEVICDQQVELGVQNPGEMSWITGWGEDEGTANNPNQLQVVGVPITTQSNYGGISADMIMAGYPEGGYDSCQGDSGGPMVVLAADGSTYLQVGVVSWGSGCAEPNYPGVYARVSYFIDWICENTNGDVCPNESPFCNDDAIYGCTDSSATNYDLNATINDGSCNYTCDNSIQLSLQLDCYGEEISWEIVNENGVTVAEVNTGTYPGGSTSNTMEEGGSLQEQEICLSAGCYTFTITDSYGDGLAGSQWSCTVDGTPFSITNQEGDLLFEETNAAFGDCEELGDESLYNDTPCSESYTFCVSVGEPIYGCTDSNASNFNPEANINDESCEFPGCTNPDYFEYDPNANVDDGTCQTLIINGCTDPNADNFNPEANIDDSSCEYAYTWYPCSDQNFLEDFEAYNLGNIDNQSSMWFGWDNMNSGAEVINNGFISDQSILIEQDDDLVYEFGDIQNGNGDIIFYCYIPSDNNSGGYFNILHDYNAENSNWAYEVFFASNESGSPSYLSAEESNIEFVAVYDKWIKVHQEIDIDNDAINFYYNDNLIHSWNWSYGSAENSSVLGALNLYGACTGTNCTGYTWFDNIEVCGFDENFNIQTNNLIKHDIYPNPNNGQFEIKINNHTHDLDVVIYNILGEKVYSKEIKYSLTHNHFVIDLSNQPRGSYIVDFSGQDYSSQELILLK